jgi:hypothetical protein
MRFLAMYASPSYDFCLIMVYLKMMSEAQKLLPVPGKRGVSPKITIEILLLLYNLYFIIIISGTTARTGPWPLLTGFRDG